VSSGRQKDTNGSYTPILTSKGRSLLTIALGNRNIGIVRYLVVEKRMLLWAEKDLSIETLVQNLDLVLRILPEDVLGEQAYDQVKEGAPGLGAMTSPPNNNGATRPAALDGSNSSHMGATTEEDLLAIRATLEMDGDFGSSHDEVGAPFYHKSGQSTVEGIISSNFSLFAHCTCFYLLLCVLVVSSASFAFQI
jgi:hypothetical protein